MRRILYLCIIVILLVNGCGCQDQQRDIHQEKILTDSEWQHISGSFLEGWGASVVENKDYIFYVKQGEIIKQNKVDDTRQTIHKINCKKDNVLWLDGKKLYYANYKEVSSIDFDGQNRSIIVSRKNISRFEKENDISCRLDIWGVQTYGGKTYLLVTGLTVLGMTERNELYEVALDVRNCCFYEDSFYFVQRSANKIYKTNLETLQMSVYKNAATKDYMRFTEVFVYEEGLYYITDMNSVVLADVETEGIVDKFSKYKSINHVQSSDNNYFVCDNKEGDSVVVKFSDGDLQELIRLPNDYLNYRGIVENLFMYESYKRPKYNFVDLDCGERVTHAVM